MSRLSFALHPRPCLAQNTPAANTAATSSLMQKQTQFSKSPFLTFRLRLVSEQMVCHSPRKKSALKDVA